MKKGIYKEAFLLCATFLGSVIGAGFASGKELSLFFMPFDKWGIFALFLSSFLMAFYYYVVLKKVYVENINNTFEYLVSISNDFFAKIIYAFIYVFSFAIFCAMFSASGALIKERYNLPFIYGTLLMAAICYMVFYKNAYGILKLNAILTPLMILGIIILGIYSIFCDKDVFNDFGIKLVKNSFVYASYNAINIIVVFCEMGHIIKSKKTAFLSGIFSFFGLFLISVILFVMLLMFKNEAMFFELPILEISKNMKDFYVVILIFAMITTAVSMGFGVLTVLQKVFNPNKQLPFLMCIMAVLFSQIGFSGMVSKVYSFFGYLGMGLFLVIFIDYIKTLKKREKYKISKKNKEKLR
ncbi:MAG: hypothetical protein E7404_00850 [Ruminococcaceae bacterium]|nr:hypothetical protein [Oscillospiraceae bacterium]